MNRLSLQDRARILGCLVEGNSLRATTRMCGVSINTVTKLLIDVGTACDLYQNETLRDLPCKRIQCDEIWSFVGAKAANLKPWQRNTGGRGDVWTWVAIDQDNKLVVSWLVGRRNTKAATVFMKDVASRLANRAQLTTDGHKPYLTAVEESFGSEIDYSTLTKLYATPPEAERRYSPAVCIGATRETVSGFPDESKVSTSHVERQNLTMRMSMRRFTRLTNGFSKKVENHAHAIALHYMYYNFGRVHKTLRVTPAMEAGVSDHVWSLEEIAGLAN
ncbi:MAG: IS1 family transposase [Candidatus Hydrogenedentales bacterium]